MKNLTHGKRSQKSFACQPSAKAMGMLSTLRRNGELLLGTANVPNGGLGPVAHTDVLVHYAIHWIAHFSATSNRLKS